MSPASESALASEIRDAVISSCERVDFAHAAHAKGAPVAVGPTLEAAKFLAEAYRLLAPEWFSPKVDARQQGLFVPPDAARPR